MSRPLAVALAGSLMIWTPPARAQQAEPPSVRAVRLDESARSVHLDGLLDEPAWGEAPAADAFRQREPQEGAPATEITEVRVLYNATTLYVGVTARDAEPAGIIARILQRDRVMEVDQFTNLPQFAGDDAVAILLDPFHDHRNAVILATNPNGAEFDALLTDEGREFNVDWRGIWEVVARRTPDGWSAEFAIPFRSLRYPLAGEGPWGFNVYRIIRRKNEEALWSAWTRGSGGFHRVSRAGHLEGLHDLPRTTANIEVKPYLLSGATQERGTAGVDMEPDFEAGIDAKYELRPGLLLDLTLNTDFAQVEIDDEQVNLTRFDLFFPEKREFFLENAGIFEFGWRGTFEPPPFLLFFSRRIGIADGGAVPVLGGARLTGRVGGQTVGLLNIVTDDVTLDNGTSEPRTNFAAARVKRDIGGASYVGAIATDRRSRDAWNTAGGFDFSLWLSRSTNLQGFAARTATSAAGGEAVAYRLGIEHNADLFGFSFGHLFIGPDATADLGFITRTDIRRTDAFGRLTPRPEMLGLRKLDLFLFGQLITRADGVAQDWQLGPALSPEWESGENVTFFGLRGFTRLDEGFSIRESDDPDEDVFVPAGDYEWWQAGWFANTSGNRPLVLSSNALLQWTYDGHVHSIGGIASLNPNANLALALGYTKSFVTVPDGSFDADIGSLRLSYAVSTRLVANALAQYNSLEKNFSVNVRINFIHRPGSDLFVVFNEQRDWNGRFGGSAVWGLDNRAAVVKLTYLARI